MISNATSIAFVVDQLSPDTISLSLQDEAHQRLLQQPPVRSITQNIKIIWHNMRIILNYPIYRDIL